MPAGDPPPFSHYVVSSTRIWGEDKARFFGVPHDRLLVTGNPRNDQFFRPVSRRALRDLALDGTKFAMYLPTYRAARALGSTRAWEDTAPRDNDVRPQVLNALLRAAQSAGVTVVLKPHPLDEWRASLPGLIVLTDADLEAAGVSLYEVLSMSDYLVTDYSSIWTDYLAADKPMAFAVPDWDAYAQGRGFNTDMPRSWLPGPIVEELGDFSSFFHDADANVPSLQAARARSAEALGLVVGDGSTSRLIAALEERGVQLNFREDRRWDGAPWRPQ